MLLEILKLWQIVTEVSFHRLAALFPTEKYLYSAHFYCCLTYSSILKHFHFFPISSTVGGKKNYFSQEAITISQQ